MEINGNNPLIGLNKNVQRLDAPKQAGRVQKGECAVSGADRLELSVRGLEISHLEDLIRSTPDVREERVEQVRREIESGTYNIKAEKIADKIIGGNLLDEVF
jgi:negative regulator of flagellin synthesis FlgM